MHCRISLIFYMHPTGYTATISTSVDSALKDENLLTCHAQTNDGSGHSPMLTPRCEGTLRLKRDHNCVLALALGGADAEQRRQEGVVQALEPALHGSLPPQPLIALA